MSTQSKTIPQINVMSSSPIKSQRREPRDTGFPEPFNDVRNTTLPHPDADLSPNACISQEDICPTRALTRSRRSILRKKRHTLSHGRISPQDEMLYSVLSLVNTDIPESDSIRAVSSTHSSIRFSKDGTDSVTSRRDEETPPTSPDVPSHRSKKNLLGRWRKH